MEATFAWDDEALRFAPRDDVARRWSPQRIAIGVGVVLLHALFWWLFEAESRSRLHEATHEDEGFVVDWIETLPPQVIHPVASPTPQAPAIRPTRERVATRPVARAPRPARSEPATDAPLQLYLPDGSVRLPDGLMEATDPLADNRRFDFQLPDLDKAGKVFDRPPALVYEPTRFNEYWEPNDDLLNEILRKAVEKTSKEIRIPIPGAPNKRIVCRVSLLAAGGSCGIERNGGNTVVSLDDPKTLSPDEAAACGAWWNRIVGATTQSEWRATRALYDAECRKPLAKVAPQAEPVPQ